jgi:hypothetical protein
MDKDTERAVREAVAREVAPILEDCKRMIAVIDRAEAALPVGLDGRAALRLRRNRVECLIDQIQGVGDKVIRLANERGLRW